MKVETLLARIYMYVHIHPQTFGYPFLVPRAILPTTVRCSSNSHTIKQERVKTVPRALVFRLTVRLLYLP